MCIKLKFCFLEFLEKDFLSEYFQAATVKTHGYGTWGYRWPAGFDSEVSIHRGEESSLPEFSRIKYGETTLHPLIQNPEVGFGT